MSNINNELQYVMETSLVQNENNTLIVDGFKVSIRDVVLFSSAKIVVELYYSEKLVGIKILNLTGEDYAGWVGQDDHYVINYVMTTLGLSPVEV
jgi:hypothetical protein